METETPGSNNLKKLVHSLKACWYGEYLAYDEDNKPYPERSTLGQKAGIIYGIIFGIIFGIILAIILAIIFVYTL